VLRPDHPAYGHLRPDYLQQLGRHHRLRQNLVPLLRAWRAAGIEALLFKGFYLAEFVYPSPGARSYGDVDVAVRPADVSRAVQVAVGLGWREGALGPLPGHWTHAAPALVDPDAGAMLDLHRLVVQSRSPFQRVQRRITEAVWAASREVEWEGVRVRVPDPIDSLVVGLVLQRCWSDDRWRIKPHDALDFRFLTDHGEIRRDAIARRARELGCSRTVEIFLSRCDPEAGVLDLAPPSPGQLIRWDDAVRRERRSGGRGERWLRRSVMLPRVLWWVLLATPMVVRARRAVQAGPGMRALLDALSAGNAVPRPTPAGRRRIVYGILWTLRIFRYNPAGDCLVRSLALYGGLRAAGWPAVFVSGVRRGEGGIEGHAWVELGGQVLEELEEPGNRSRYTVNFSHPDSA